MSEAGGDTGDEGRTPFGFTLNDPVCQTGNETQLSNSHEKGILVSRRSVPEPKGSHRGQGKGTEDEGQGTGGKGKGTGDGDRGRGQGTRDRGWVIPLHTPKL